jgi:hypothetical protein
MIIGNKNSKPPQQGGFFCALKLQSQQILECDPIALYNIIEHLCTAYRERRRD